jgi:hypothetical protein
VVGYRDSEDLATSIFRVKREAVRSTSNLASNKGIGKKKKKNFNCSTHSLSQQQIIIEVSETRKIMNVFGKYSTPFHSCSAIISCFCF